MPRLTPIHYSIFIKVVEYCGCSYKRTKGEQSTIILISNLLTHRAEYDWEFVSDALEEFGVL
jgi:hypothetical protein